MTRPRVVLVGMPGAGKSTTGRRLARILAVPFTDSDDLIEAAAGVSIGALVERTGEAAFRALEATQIAAAMGEFTGVLALGGGALTTSSTRELLASAPSPVVVLRARLATLATRVGDAHNRPLLAGDPAGRLSTLALERQPLFDEVATFVVDTDGRTPGQVAATIAARLHENGFA